MEKGVWQLVETAGSLPVWVILNVLDTALFIYLVTGILPDIRKTGRTGRVAAWVLFAFMGVLTGMEYRIGSMFSDQAFLYGLVVLIIGMWLAYRKDFLLIAGISMSYSGFSLLLSYVFVSMASLVCSVVYSETASPNIYLLMGDSVNSVFCGIRFLVLLLLLPVSARLRSSGIRHQIREYRMLLSAVGAVLCGLVLGYQDSLNYGFLHAASGISEVGISLRDGFFHLLLSVILVAAVVILVFKNRSIRREKEFLLLKEEMEQHKYEELRGSVEKNRELVHDMKNHYLVIRGYIDSGDYDSLARYVDSLQEGIARTDTWVYTGNHVLDLILGQKRSTAREKGISFDLQASPLSRLPFAEREICALFGNLLDNAIEACERMGTDGKEAGTDTGKEIHVKIEQRNQMLYVEIQNTAEKAPEKKGRGFLTDKEDGTLHGYGLKSVERIVEEHDGVIEYEGEAKTFTVRITFFDVGQ